MSNAKPPTQTGWRGVSAYLEGYSKNALIDLVIDLIRQSSGAPLDGIPLVQAIHAAAKGTSVARHDRQPSVKAWEKGMVRYIARMRKLALPETNAAADFAQHVLDGWMATGDKR